MVNFKLFSIITNIFHYIMEKVKSSARFEADKRRAFFFAARILIFKTRRCIMFLMKKNAIIFLVSAALALSLISCESTKQEAPAAVQEPTEDDLEYQRSINKIEGSAVSKETFNADKAAIMKKIAELNNIMTKKDYSSWLNYIAADSKKYWSDNYTLAKASEKLPKELKGVKLKNLGDYFNYVFIPSRKGRQIDEIRYNSAESVKAVQVTKTEDDKTKITVYYNFVKENGDWKVELPQL